MKNHFVWHSDNDTAFIFLIFGTERCWLPYKVQYMKIQTHCGLELLGACTFASTLYPASLSIFGKIECISYWQVVINGSTLFQNSPKVSSRIVSRLSRIW